MKTDEQKLAAARRTMAKHLKSAASRGGSDENTDWDGERATKPSPKAPQTFEERLKALKAMR